MSARYHALPGSPTSLWLGSTPELNLQHLAGELEVDVAVVGGGIAGLTTAMLLHEAGKRVAVLEAHRLFHGVSGFTTAKVTSQHGLIYDHLLRHFGEVKARGYADSQQAAIEQIAELSRRRGIECDFERGPAYTTVADQSAASKVEAEVEAAQRLGLPAAFVKETELPFPIAAGIRFDNQARFHPRKYLLGLATQLRAEGVHIFEESRVRNISDDAPYRLETEHGAVTARDVVLATHFPVMDKGFYFARLAQYRSYVLALRINGVLPQGMYLGEEPFYSVRPQRQADGEWLLVGGEKHKAGQGEDTIARYERLEAWARQHFDVAKVDYRWSTQDNWSLDRVPYIGPSVPNTPHLFVATGFGGWGMTNGTVAAMLLTDLILERENPWAEVYSPCRFNLESVPSLLRENVDAVGHILGGLFPASRSQELEPGEGAICESPRGKVAVYRREDGEFERLSPVCTHMGCIVNWNPAEKSWDCPCHGGRFTAKGTVLHGPPNADLKPFDEPETEPTA